MTATIIPPTPQPDTRRPPKVRTKEPASKSIFDPAIVGSASIDAVPQAEPADDVPQPGDVHRRGRLGPHHGDLHPRLRQQHRPGERVRRSRVAVAVVHRAVRQLRRGDGRGPRQGAGGDAAQDPRRDDRHGSAPPTARSSRRRRRRSQLGDLCVVDRRRGDPRRRRHRRGHRHRRRVGDHRRVRPGRSANPAATARPSPAARGC